MVLFLGLIYLSFHLPNDSVGPFTARGHFLSGTLAPTLPLCLLPHCLANGLGWRISPYPSSGHILKSSEAPLYSLAELLLLITVLLKYHWWGLPWWRSG